LDMFIGCRLYTGPMYFKYGLCLRGLPGGHQFLTSLFEKNCKGNTYAATLCTINAGLFHLSKLMPITKVYRGPGGRLGDSFWSRDTMGISGGVDFSFASTSLDYDTAAHYARLGTARMIFECSMGMGDRGAQIGWLSQYPGEAEVCMPPLTAFEVQTTTKVIEVNYEFVILEPCTEESLLAMLQVDAYLDPLPGASGPAVRNLHMLARTLRGQWERIAAEEEQRGTTRGFVTIRQPVRMGDALSRMVGVFDAWSGRVLAVAADSAVYDAGLKMDYSVKAIDGYPVIRDMLTAVTDARLAYNMDDSRGRKVMRLTVSHHDTEVRGDMLVVKMRVSVSARSSSMIKKSFMAGSKDGFRKGSMAKLPV